ncbi:MULTISPECIES: glycerophosphodiester phosphodiesterase family protein [Microbacterium]|uniref:glycerophosphodiester phosphodiesterase family protein n=1 Tax=Microbacterium TaxID=33882 RepID=UPI00217E37C2|nr:MULTISPECIES: glycerophosphodiester phosphodiesterase family protein [Microbacterium]UWF76592.1 glycerophosphodiester phosphodiesterase [Microbacterium neungamense]WCM54744.1 glycerophosphodiester phosphodiesterase [Microbacterium sp. EF45047]
MTHPYFAGARHPRVLAHRGFISAEGGDSGVWENTAAAVAGAHAVGAEFVETDCRVTADGDVVLFHDDTLRRLAGDPHPVSQVRTRDLERMLAPHGGLLTVADALDAFPDLRFNIDVKTDAAAAPLGALIADHTDRVLVTSFSDRRRRAAVASALRAGAAQRPAASAGRTTIAGLRAASAIRLSPTLSGIDAVQIPVRHRGVTVFTPALVRAAHRRGIEVHVWTVDDPDEMRRLVAAGADGIVTDRTDLALRTLGGG